MEHRSAKKLTRDARRDDGGLSVDDGWIVAIFAGITAVIAAVFAGFPHISKLWKQKHDQGMATSRNLIGQLQDYVARLNLRLEAVEKVRDELIKKSANQGAHIRYLEKVMVDAGLDFQPWKDHDGDGEHDDAAEPESPA